MSTQVILASRSPQREKILKDAQIFFQSITSDVNETPVAEFSFAEQLKEISMRKALAAMMKTGNVGDRIIVSADQNIMFDEKMYGKPKTIEEARELIKSMEGSNEIYAYVGNTVLYVSENQAILKRNRILKYINEFDFARMRMDCISDMELEEYLVTKSPLDKCGGINIFDTPFLHLEEGKMSTAGGLTVEYLIKMFKMLE